MPSPAPDIIDISWARLLLAHGAVLVPAALFWLVGARLFRSTLVAALRMSLQLYLLGFYLGYLFELDNPWLNLAWVLAMLGIGAQTISSRAGLRLRHLALPVFIGSLASLAVVDAFFLSWVIGLERVFEARYFITISGMILGNALSTNVVAFESYFRWLRDRQDELRLAQSQGASLREATRPLLAQALEKSFNPVVGRMAVVGLIALPGTMTGQIVGGSSPEVAVKYQVALLLAIFASTAFSVLLTIALARRVAFDPMGRLKEDIFLDP